MDVKPLSFKEKSLRPTVEMTYLSNERSFLAYLRTFIVFVSSGVAILNIEKFKQYVFLGYVVIVLGIGILLFGLYRVVRVNKNIAAITKSGDKPFS